MIVKQEIRQMIEAELEKIEKVEDVAIFYACESGSRGRGFESQDSDYDVRFLYLHRPAWYLTIQSKADVIERPISDDLDISGWDIRKALTLFRRSNPHLLEYLQSPIVYNERSETTDGIRKLMTDYYSPKSCLYHYLHMAQGNYRKYLKGEEVWVKKYFYVLRPVLACKWIESDLGVVPMEFQKLVDRTVTDSELRVSIDDLLKRKRKGHELDRGPAIPTISEFVEEELLRLGVKNDVRPAVTSDPARLDALFVDALREVWGVTIRAPDATLSL